MDEQEFKNLEAEGKVEKINSEEQPSEPAEKSPFSEYADIFNLLRSLKRNLAADPTGASPPQNPKGILDQFHLFNDELYVFIPRADGTKAAGSWVKIGGGGLQVKGVDGSRGADGAFSVTGLTFTPKAVVAIGFSSKYAGAKTVGFSAANASVFSRTISQNADNIYGALLYFNDSTGANWSKIEVVSFDAAGISLSVSSGGANALTIYYAFLILG